MSLTGRRSGSPSMVMVVTRRTLQVRAVARLELAAVERGGGLQGVLERCRPGRPIVGVDEGHTTRRVLLGAWRGVAGAQAGVRRKGHRVAHSTGDPRRSDNPCGPPALHLPYRMRATRTTCSFRRTSTWRVLSDQTHSAGKVLWSTDSEG